MLIEADWAVIVSDVGTNLKVRGGQGGTRPTENFVVLVPLHFLDLQVQLFVLVSAFVHGQYSLEGFAFAVLLLIVTLCQDICRSEASSCPLALWSRRHRK